MDFLSWAWSDRLLPNHRSLPAPFSQEECQELLSLLRSFPDQGDGRRFDPCKGTHQLNFNEAVNFALLNWLPYGRDCVQKYREHRELPVFSHDKLLIAITHQSPIINTAMRYVLRSHFAFCGKVVTIELGCLDSLKEMAEHEGSMDDSDIALTLDELLKNLATLATGPLMMTLAFLPVWT
ncbi:hypothetical protein BDN72DRAFT_893856 [Pluteus cervinus]|uniref:Uncharacterized protein n=1 Tax=Pluteus cervinus TaxID=181527 RepID=A0ACD3B7M0_9AGAR|nr:hypothetical protein BDN72DRAFT_893856 [Pluteus cervinus]